MVSSVQKQKEIKRTVENINVKQKIVNDKYMIAALYLAISLFVVSTLFF